MAFAGTGPIGSDSGGGFKIILCGDVAVGKSNLMHRFLLRDEYRPVSQATMGPGFGSKYCDIDGQRVKALIWDTAGQDTFRSITTLYYRGAHAALIVYDVTRADTFESVESWYNDLTNSCGNPNVVVTLVGNKIDLINRPGLGTTREVPFETAQQYASQKGMLFFETSAYDDINVVEAFEETLRAVLQSLPPPTSVPPLNRPK